MRRAAWRRSTQVGGRVGWCGCGCVIGWVSIRDQRLQGSRELRVGLGMGAGWLVCCTCCVCCCDTVQQPPAAGSERNGRGSERNGIESWAPPTPCCAVLCPVPADYLPAAVDPEAPKANRPALCLASSKGTAATAAEAFTCEASENHMRRLCPCVKGADGGGSSSVSSKGSSSVASKGSTEGGGAAAAAGQHDTAAKEGAQKPSSSSSNSSTGGATEPDAATTAAAATQPGADKGQQQQQQQEELPGPDELGATNEEGNGGDASTDGAADGEGDMREYEEDPDRGE